jgi:hypothetical protein
MGLMTQYNALQSLQALEMGQGQRKERERETAMKGIGNALAGGDLRGATAQAFAVDPMYGMQIDQYATGKNALATRQGIGAKWAAGDKTGAKNLALTSGDLETTKMLEEWARSATVQQREDAAYIAGEVGKLASAYEGMAPEQIAVQWQADQQMLVSQYGMDPAQLSQFNPLDPNERRQAILQAQTMNDILAGQRWQQGFDREGEYRTQDIDWRTSQAAEETRRWNAEQAAAKAEREAKEAAGADRKTAKDQNGVLRYLDNGEPVFPNVPTKPEVNKPLIGAESMGRVAAGLPNMRQAVEDLKSALGVSITGGTATTMEGGYRPGQDWGAMAWDQVPVVGDVFARGAGGEDYQKFDNAYSTFEAAALPIMSGAAVTDSEAKRALKALRVRIGDTDEAVARKMANMNRMVAGLEAAAAGDTAALQSIIGGINSGGASGGDDVPPMISRDDLIRKYLD